MRNLEINSSDFPIQQQLDALCAVSKCLKEQDQEFFVIGATSRDLLSIAIGVDFSPRASQDLDITLAISSWNVFEELKERLVENGFTKDPERKQKFYYNRCQVDLVPFGGVSPDGEKIFWPPEESPEMTVRGFDSVLSDCLKVTVKDKGIDFNVPTMAGLFILKFDAWIDRGVENSKDVDDMMYILDSYFLPNSTEPRYTDVYDVVEDADPFVSAAYMLAVDAKELLTEEECAFYSSIIEGELAKEENSRLLQQSLGESHQNYETVKRAWAVFSSTIKHATDDEV